MDWLSALWGDILAHVESFDLSPPRTLSDLQGWIWALGVPIAVVVFIYRRARRSIEAAIPSFKFGQTCRYMDELASELIIWRIRGVLDPRRATVSILEMLYDADFRVIFVVLLACIAVNSGTLVSLLAYALLIWGLVVASRKSSKHTAAVDAVVVPRGVV